MTASDPISFILKSEFKDLPPRVVSDALRGLTDTLGVAGAASQTDLARIIKDHAAAHFGAGEVMGADLWQDGRRVSPVGAALAHGMTIDALDAHDGSKPTKGHVGCGVVAAALAMADGCSGPELITRIAIGYEIGTRAGISLHATAKDYHTSGAWIALACAAISARALKLDPARTREALGIAEFHGPRSQMMRCIDHPTMVKDGSGWGAMAGVSAALLARDGFTGAPAITVEDVSLSALWSDLGQRWYISEQYIKLYPVCRWAQPAVEAALELMRAHAIAPRQVVSVQVETFEEAACLTSIPETTEQAQYSLPFSVAAAIWRGGIGVSEVGPEGYQDAAIMSLAREVKMTTRAEFDAAFPDRRFAVVHLTLKDGRILTSSVTEAQGDPEDPLSADEIAQKFDRLTSPVLGDACARNLRREIGALETRQSCERVLALLSATS